ncbi:hypothetical protein [Streptomyces guryensis]|uniref:Uncharacterized protein n=1 Tax=Streptomyces guryensis TaxID=2886947 RepID=A0A9Q3VQK4_9ACTN|nr:hypothetical protein [Streptomyces guryensis]MCD9876834.1 hypothetical protein [Streptomyces guryensis]
MLSLGCSPCDGGIVRYGSGAWRERAGLLPITAFGVLVVLTALPLRRGLGAG